LKKEVGTKTAMHAHIRIHGNGQSFHSINFPNRLIANQRQYKFETRGGHKSPKEELIDI
jgi:hypothetical protein